MDKRTKEELIELISFNEFDKALEILKQETGRRAFAQQVEELGFERCDYHKWQMVITLDNSVYGSVIINSPNAKVSAFIEELLDD